MRVCVFYAEIKNMRMELAALAAVLLRAYVTFLRYTVSGSEHPLL